MTSSEGLGLVQPTYESCGIDVVCINRNNVKEQDYLKQLYASLGISDISNVPGTPNYVPPTTPSTTNVSNMSRVDIYTTGYNVGDTWTIKISGAVPGKSVSVNGGMNGTVSNTKMGSTDGAGNFVLSGRFDNSSVGSWAEDWAVDNSLVGSLRFMVSPVINIAPPPVPFNVAPLINVVAQSQATSGVTSQVPSVTGVDTATSANVFDLFGTMDNQINVPGTGIQVGSYTAVLAVGALVVGYMMMNKGRR
jgi:hypothetical protein